MKTKILMCATLLSLMITQSSVFAQNGTKLIGTFNEYVGSVNSTNMVSVASSWENYLNFIGDSMLIDTMWIDTMHHLDAPGYKWYLFAANYTNAKKALIGLIIDNTDELYEIVNGGMGVTVTCTGCTDGCDPKLKKETGQYICTVCNFSGTCTKTSSTKTGAVTDY
jgi:hypothetical protein